MGVTAAVSHHRRILLGASVAAYALVFAAFVLVEHPGLGIAHFFYLAIALLALATGPAVGAGGGLVAAVLYVGGILLNPAIQWEVYAAPAGIRLVSFTVVGALVGFYARRNRELVGRLRLLADRDALTGLPNTRAFEAAIARRLRAAEPFALLVGDLDGLKQINDRLGHAEGNELLERIARMLGTALRPEDDVARVGGDEFAVLTRLQSGEEAARLAARLERVLRDQGASITFGWAVRPQDGNEALSLYRAADERLYARKVLRTRDDPVEIRLAASLEAAGA